MSGGFAQRLTLIMCLSNYLLHDLFFLLHCSSLKSFTASPTFSPQKQSVNNDVLLQF